jgi:hypothetical protein
MDRYNPHLSCIVSSKVILYLINTGILIPPTSKLPGYSTCSEEGIIFKNKLD